MSSSVQITTKNGRLIARISLTFFILANFIWLFLPFLMAGVIQIFSLNHYLLSVGKLYGKPPLYLKQCLIAIPLHLRFH